MIEGLARNVRIAVRSLIRRPRFALLAMAAFAVGIGSNVAIFSLLDDVLLDPLPFPESDRLVLVWERHRERGMDQVPAAPAKFFDWREERSLFESMTLWRTDDMELAGEDEAQRVTVGQVLPGLLPMLGLTPAGGRGFQEDEAEPGRNGVLVLTHHFWTEHLGADPDAVGRSLTLGGRPHTVVGVLPAGEVFPSDVDLYRPLALENASSRTAHAYRVLARLAPGTSLEEARRGMEEVAARLASTHPETDAGFDATVQPLRERIMGPGLGSRLLLLQGAVGLVLLIACANVSSLLLVRATGRRKELAVRAALGAGRGHLVTHQVTESVMLAMAGGALGLILAPWGVGLVVRLSPVELPAARAAGMDGTVLGFALAISVASGALFGLLPALHGTRRDMASTLRESGGTASRGRARLRSTLVTAEVALATLLLLGSGLFLRSLAALHDVDPGFRPEGLLSAEVRPPSYRYATGRERAVLYRSLLESLEGRPGITAVGAVSYLPMGGRSDLFRFEVEGRPVERFADLLVAPIRAVSPGYLAVMGTEVLRGRSLEPGDRADTQPVAVVSETMADRFWPGEDPLDARISFSGDEGPWVRIVGVVEDVHGAGLAEAAEATVYVPMDQEPWPAMVLVLRTEGDPLARVETVREVVRAHDPMLPVASVRTVESVVDATVAPWRFQAVLVALLGSLAVLLASVGVYGLLNYVVQERTTELGIRRALGARADQIGRLVVGEVGSLVAVGVALGVAGGALLSHTVRGMLFEVSPLDPVSYVGAAGLLLGVGLLATWLPVRRALALEPASVLRRE